MWGRDLWKREWDAGTGSIRLLVANVRDHLRFERTTFSLYLSQCVSNASYFTPSERHARGW
jgi:hypothetical protein